MSAALLELEPRHARPYDVTRDGCSAHDAATACDWHCVWRTYVGRHDDSRGRIGTASRVSYAAARRAFHSGARVLIANRDRGPAYDVYPGTVTHRHTDGHTWPEILAGCEDAGADTGHTFYVMPERVR